MNRFIILLLISLLPLIGMTAEQAPKAPIKKEVRKVSSTDRVLPAVPEKFDKGTTVEILDYDAEFDCFAAAPHGSGEQGPFFFSPEEVIRATGASVSLKDFTNQKKQDFVGSEHVLIDDMKMLNEQEYLAREKK